MVKNKFVADYQINTSRKVLFPYLSSASGLTEWFADDVTITPTKDYIFHFDGEQHYARISAIRSNAYVKFEYFDPTMEDEEDHSYFEFKIEENELTQTLFLKVVDYNDDYDGEELEYIWEGLIQKLKEIIGG